MVGTSTGSRNWDMYGRPRPLPPLSLGTLDLLVVRRRWAMQRFRPRRTGLSGVARALGAYILRRLFSGWIPTLFGIMVIQLHAPLVRARRADRGQIIAQIEGGGTCSSAFPATHETIDTGNEGYVGPVACPADFIEDLERGIRFRTSLPSTVLLA